jgi:hypothetical protein
MNLQRSSLAAPATLTALLFLANCSDDNPPATNSAGASAGGSGASAGGSGASAGGGGASGGSASGIEPSFAMLKGVIQGSCFGAICHDLPEHPLQLKLDDKLYGTLTSHMTKHCGPVLTPGDPQGSALVKLLKGPCNGTDRMPYGKCFADGDEGCIGPEYIAAIEKWIANGAPQ